MDKEVAERLKEVGNWDKIIMELTYYASVRIGRITWRYDRVPKGMTSEAIALQAISAIFDETRHWNPQKDPDLMRYLKSVVNSLVSHLYELKEYKTTERFQENKDGAQEEPLPANPDAPHASAILRTTTTDPEFTLLKKEDDERAKKMIDQFLDFLDDDDLGEIVICLLDDITKDAEIAKQLSVEVEEIYRRRKRLKRRYGDFANFVRKKVFDGGEEQQRRSILEVHRESV